MTFRRFAFSLVMALAVLVGASRTTYASSIGLEVTFQIGPGGPPGTSVFLHFGIVEDPNYTFPGFLSGQSLAAGGGNLLTGTTTKFYVFVTLGNLDNIYFFTSGDYAFGPLQQGGPIVAGAFVAEPVIGGWPSDVDVYPYGQLGIPLAPLLGLGSFGSGLHTFVGYPLGYPAGNPNPGTWQITTTPEPSSLILLASGLALPVLIRRRLSRRALNKSRMPSSPTPAP